MRLRVRSGGDDADQWHCLLLALHHGGERVEIGENQVGTTSASILRTRTPGAGHADCGAGAASRNASEARLRRSAWSSPEGR